MTSDERKQLIGQRLNEALTKRGIKQKELAKMLGIQENAISYFIKGERTPNTVLLTDICGILDISADYLLGLTDVSSTSMSVQEIAAKTHLTESVVDQLIYAVNEIPEGFDGLTSDWKEREFELINFLIETVFASRMRGAFLGMLQSLRLPSAPYCAETLAQDPQFQKYFGKDIPQIRSLIETYFGQDEFLSEGSPIGQCALTPDEAFSFYRSEICRNLQDRITEIYEPQNAWGKIDDFKDELYAQLQKDRSSPR